MAKSLLAVLCDAVVVVDADLNFRMPSPQIAHFLLRQPPQNCYQGSSFLDFVEQSDRDRIGQQVLSLATGAGTTLSVSTRLIDGNGSAVQVQVYCTCFLDEDDLRWYVLGILEVRDLQTSPGDRADSIAVDDVTQSMGVIPGFSVLQSVSESGAPSESIVSGESTETAMVPLTIDHDALVIIINISEPTVPVMKASLQITHMSGPLVYGESSFLEWFRPGDAGDVISDISAAFGAFVEAPSTTTSVVSLLSRISLQPPHAQRAGLRYTMSATVDMTHLLHDDLDGDVVPVCLRFHDVSVRQKSRKKRGLRSVLRHQRSERSAGALTTFQAEHDTRLQL
eukprot:TRINITY_DN38349_c0_g1_i2.p1 TRINITY_DN38349_c0_g1~~TRINITY_DN38349_c0_g1_i2.p1  ORF type:complete len:338 (-),score=34.73 TRINITY_DN38349_c0_g1_i2:259-1272(-)